MMVASLRDPRRSRRLDSIHPERWVRGTQHPSLPPCPPLWKTPRIGEPLPFPSECQLNPFLEHVLIGVTPLLWDIKDQVPMYPLLDFDKDPVQYLSPADVSQPATWPFVTHFYINAIADERTFLWPILVTNPYGVKCRDIFKAIYKTFQEPMSQAEIDSLPVYRRQQAHLTHHAEIEPGEHVIRLDLLCQRSIFRGLEPNSDGQGWVMFLGYD